MNTRTKIFSIAAAALFAIAIGAPAMAQQHVLLDKAVKAGDLTLLQDVDDPAKYYYISDKPHLATRADGSPEFSFLRWVENTRSGADQPEAREGEGGGIIHALVALSSADCAAWRKP